MHPFWCFTAACTPSREILEPLIILYRPEARRRVPSRERGGESTTLLSIAPSSYTDFREPSPSRYATWRCNCSAHARSPSPTTGTALRQGHLYGSPRPWIEAGAVGASRIASGVVDQKHRPRIAQPHRPSAASFRNGRPDAHKTAYAPAVGPVGKWLARALFRYCRTYDATAQRWKENRPSRNGYATLALRCSAHHGGAAVVAYPA